MKKYFALLALCFSVSAIGAEYWPTLIINPTNGVVITPATVTNVTFLGAVTYKQQVTTATNNYAVDALDSTVLCDAINFGVTNSLPNATNLSGRVITFKRIDVATNNFVVIAPVEGQFIDNQINISLSQFMKTVTIQAYSTNWFIIGGN